MERTSTVSINLARTGLAVLLVWNVVRAVSQSVTPGEAWSYDRYIGPPWKDALESFDSNNYMLNTLLVRISTWRFHLTELSLRLPSLLFGIIYMIAAYRIARRWFGGGAMFLAVLGMLVLNPLVVDAMSEARGYGLGLAAWMWGLDLLTREDYRKRSRGVLAGVLLGLSVSASLAFLVPVLALIVVAQVSNLPRLRYTPHLAFLTAFVLLVLPLNHAEKSLVTDGANSLRQTLNFLTAASFGTGNPIAAALTRIVVALLAVAGGAIAIYQRKTSPIIYVSGAAIALALVFLLAANRFVHSAYPLEGALYLVPLITIFVAALVAQRGSDSTQFTFVAIAAVCVGAYVNQLRPPYRAARGVDRSRQIAVALRANAARRPVSIGASADALAVMRYYKWRYRQANWESIEDFRSRPAFNYYVLDAADAGLVRERGLRLLHHEPDLVVALP